MRLTLRTLLAYMDDILDPADQEDLARQVETSETASELIHRTRDAMRRLRLGAPPVMGEGMELNPNFVAEYLDNTMSAEDMTDFQQVCLDSDVHLAEVASCHHILTMVLGEPAQIDPEMRSRMYAVPERADEWHRQRADGPHVSAATNGIPHEVSTATEEHPSEVPDYLRASERSMAGRWALAFAAALVLGVTAFMALGPDGWLRQDKAVVQNDLEDAGAAAVVPAEGAVSESVTTPNETTLPKESTTPHENTGAAAVSPEVAVGTIETPAADGPGGLPPIEGAPTGESPLVENSATEAGPDMLAPPVEGAAPPVLPDGLAGVSEPEDVVPRIDAPADAAEAAGEGVRVAAVPSPLLPEGTDLAEVAGPGAEGEAGGELMVPPQTPLTEEEIAGVEAGAVPPAAAPLGTVVGLQEVLLRWDETNREWRRLAPRASIVAGDRLLSLPTYRPSLALVLGLRVEFSDGAMMTLGYTEDGAMPRLEVTYGQVLLQNTGIENVAFELMIAGETAQVELVSTAVLGLDVDRPFVPGRPVAEAGGAVVAQFYAPEGGVLWTGSQGVVSIDYPAQWTWQSMVEKIAPASFTAEAAWLNGQSLDDFEQNVSRNIEKGFDTERPARQQLLEFYETSRRREEKALAALCATHVWQFIPFVQALADTQQQSSWHEHIAHLRKAMSRSPDAANLVRETLVEQRGAAVADDLYAMLRGYGLDQIGTTPDEIKIGITRQLIDWLDHDRLEYRVLAFHNLQEIYGGRTHNYNPVNTDPDRRERTLRTWRKRLADNDLTPVLLN